MISINIDSISSIIGSITILSFAFYYLISYLTVRKERLHFVISMTLFSFFTYLAGYSVYSTATALGTVLFWTRVCYAAGAVIIYSSYLLSSEIVQKDSPLLRKGSLIVVFVLLILIFIPGNHFFIKELNPAKSHSSVMKGPLFPYLLVTIYLSDLILFIRFFRELYRSKAKLYLIKPILYGLIFLFAEALFDGIFGALLSISHMKLSLGPIIITFSLALYSARFVALKNEELFRIQKENKTIYNNLIYDDLSRLYSRQYFIEALTQRIAAIGREGSGDCLLFMDVDHFKSVNDELGHSYGDRLIAHVGETFNRHSRKNDICARYGGDEFLILLSHCTVEDAERIAEDLQNKLSSGVKKILGHWKDCSRISFSVGIVSSAFWGEDAAEIIHRADMAMYEAKKMEQNSIAFYTEYLEKSG